MTRAEFAAFIQEKIGNSAVKAFTNNHMETALLTLMNVLSGLPDTVTAQDILNASKIAAWGDSLISGGAGSDGIIDQLTESFGGAKTVYNGGVGGETSTQVRTRMLAATDKHNDTTVIWVGQNNYNAPATIKSDVAAMVAALGHDRYVILSLINGDDSVDWEGGAAYEYKIALNEDLAELYPNNFLDVRTPLVAAYNPNSSEDVTDHNHDVVPSSLRGDAIHLNEAGEAIVAELIHDFIKDSIDEPATPISQYDFIRLLEAFGGSVDISGKANVNNPAFTGKASVTENTDGDGERQLMLTNAGAGGVGLLMKRNNEANGWQFFVKKITGNFVIGKEANGDWMSITPSTGQIGIGFTDPAVCAQFEIKSTDRGLLLPRMTKAQRDAISTPLAGLAVYQTDNTPGLRVYNGTNWVRMTETND